MSVRFLDKACSPILCGCPCRNWKNEDCDKFSSIGLYITSIWSIPVATYAAGIVIGLYIIPLPTSPLATYIENTVQILLVVLAALVSYKIISFELSEVNIFFKSFKKSYESGIIQFEANMTMPGNIIADGINNVTCNSININSSRGLTIPRFDIQFIVTVENENQNVSARLQHRDLGEIAVSKAFANQRRITSRMLQSNLLSFQTEGNPIICAGAELIVPISDVGISAACIIMCFENDANDVRNILIPPYCTTLRITANSVSVYLQNNNDGNGIAICENQTINNATTIVFKDITRESIYHTILITGQDGNRHEVKLHSFRIEVNDGNLSIISADPINPQNLDMTGNPAIANFFSHNDAYSDHANPVKAYIPKSTEFENPLDSTGRILGKIAHRVRHIGL